MRKLLDNIDIKVNEYPVFDINLIVQAIETKIISSIMYGMLKRDLSFAYTYDGFLL